MSKAMKSWIIRLHHIIEAIEKIQNYTADMTEDEFYEDEKTTHAVERNFEIIGEASKHIPENIRAKHNNIEWLDMRDMRNIITHQYDDVEEYILWETVQEDLPPLKTKIKKLLEEYSD